MPVILVKFTAWLLFFGGIIGMAMGFVKYFNDSPPVEYGVMGIGGGFYLAASAATFFMLDLATRPR